MTKTRMLDGTYCYTGPQCQQHANAIRESFLVAKQNKDLTKEEKVFIAKRQFDTDRNPKSFDETRAADPETWWTCPVAPDHRWQKTKNKRTGRGDGCPFCSGHRASSTNNLPDLAPHLLQELVRLPKGVESARELTVNSNKECGWKCKNCGHEWPATPNTRSRSGCEKCQERTGGFILTFENSIAGRYPHLVKDLDIKANGCTADMLSAGSPKPVKWKCHICGHKWPASILNRGRRGDRCPTCSGKVPKKGESMFDLYPEIAAELNEEASGFRAIDKKPGSGKEGIWNCSVNPDHPSWPAQVRSRTGHNHFKTKFGCPTCTQAHTSIVEQNFRAAFAPYLTKMLSMHEKLELPWRKNKRMSVDIMGLYREQPVAIEYDGYFYHYEKVDTERDLDKTQALLTAGYLVVRIREGQLTDLNTSHSNLLQTNFVHTNDTQIIAAEVDRIMLWLDTKCR